MDSLMFKELVQSRVIPVFSIMIGTIFLASCSSGVSRFDFPMFGLSSTDGDSSTSSLPMEPTIPPSANDLTQYSGGGELAGFDNNSRDSAVVGRSTNYNTRNSYLPAQTAAPEVRAARYGAVERAPARYDAKPMKPIGAKQRSFLPSEPRGYDYNSRTSIKSAPAMNSATARRPMNAITGASNGNQSVTISSGDTLYSIGRRHNVSVVELMDLNKLTDSNLTVGQQLIVPGVGPQQAARSQTKQVRATSSGTYTVRPGESFQNIAAKHSVSTSELADVNGITDPGSIRAGEVLILPKGATAGRSKKARASKPLRKMAKVSQRGQSKLKVRQVKTQSINLGSTQKQSKPVSKKQQVVAMKKTGRKRAVSSAFRWPVRGRIIGKFGPRKDGTHNDGINLAVPNGTKVKAAESGVVAYAGSELEGYGNLVLIRHSNDWVSAYAHNDKLMVKRGEKIKRGQIIARAGTSGSVEVPQVHFELRKGSKPVDPTKFMAGT